MQYMKLNVAQREQMLAGLDSMPTVLRQAFAGLTPEDLTRQGPNASFSPIEQVWHLADLEREGFAVRIDRLLNETAPNLPDFDGTQVALKRNYRALSFEAGLHALEQARSRNVDVLRDVPVAYWFRTGKQEGVGEVSLCDMPGFMAQHDAAHKEEIAAWRRARDAKRS
ncbi:MAG: DinB family protein [Betaproteobacteria bacterium]|nr:DinB family protein [Betaproteobacteria bacterium]